MTIKGGTRAVFPLIVFVLAGLVYAPTLGFKFVYDDLPQILNNPKLRSWEYAGDFLAGHVWDFDPTAVAGNYYRPVFQSWLLLNYSLFGPEPQWWHATTILLHVIATVLVYILAKQILGDLKTACFAALIFGLHPIHTEAVAWVSGLTEPLLAILLLSSLICYLRSQTTSSLLFYFAALLAKETALVLPLMIAVHAWGTAAGAPAKPRGRRVVRTALPYLAVSIVYLVLRQHALHHFGVVLTPLSARTILLTWPSVLWFYVQGLIWPFGRGLFPDLSYVSTPTLRNFWLYLLAMAACMGTVWWWSRGRREDRFALICMGLPILPVLNFAAFSEGELAHDRYLYVPSAFFAVVAARAIVDYAKRPAIQAAVMAGATAIYGYATVRESRPYANGVDLFSRGLTTSPNNNIAAANLAAALFEENRPAEAIPLLEAVQRRRADLPGVVYLIGLCYFRMNLSSEAETYLRRAIQITPQDPRPRLMIGLIQFSRNELSEAESSIREGIRLQPTRHYWFYHFHLGRVLEAKGDRKAALAQFEEELVHNPGLPEAKAEIQKLRDAVVAH